MNTAKSILAERLAKGEISEEEYDKLTAKLHVGQSTGTAPVKTRKSTGLYILGGFALGIYAISLMSGGAMQSGQLIAFLALLLLLYGLFHTIQNMRGS